MSIQYCKCCQKYRVNGSIPCDCRLFTVWLGDWQESDGGAIYRRTPEEAAEDFCRKWDWDSTEFTVATAGETLVLVRDSQTGEIKHYTVQAHQEIIYQATQKMQEESEAPND